MVINKKSLIENIPAQIAAIPGQLESYANKVANQIVQDTSYLAEAKLAVVQNAVANSLVDLFQNECTAQVLSAVMIQPLKDEVQRVTDDVLSRKLISIG